MTVYTSIVLFACLTCIGRSRRLKDATALSELAESDSQGKEKCRAKMERLTKLGKQVLGPKVGVDPEFLPQLSSIADRGTKCGDSAQGISKSCEDFNQWLTFQKVASNMGKPFSVMESEPKFSDVKQGQLGNCYFLAALAAVAVNHPDVISDMFVDRHLWESNEFRTKWLINGKTETLVVDNLIPAWNDKRGTFFTRPADSGKFWPVILAKTWAKIFGSFKAVESGIATEAVRAMTRAPAHYIKLKDGSHTDQSIWRVLKDGKDNKHPMVASTCGDCGDPRKFGLAEGHGYAILDVKTLPGKGNVVKMFNPWARIEFKGRLQQSADLNGPESGVFTMLASEFFQAFHDLSVTYVTAGYKVSSFTIPAGELYAAQLSMPAPGKFWVSLVWPSARLVKPCPYLEPKGAVKLEFSAQKGTLVGKELASLIDDPDQSVEIENGKTGVYNVLAELDFRRNSSWMSSVELTVYGPGVAKIEGHTSAPQDLAIEMLGPNCKVASLPEVGLVEVDMTTTIGHGIPTYWTVDRDKFAYYRRDVDQWYVTSPSKIKEIKQGTYWSTHKFHKGDFKCGCHDAEEGVVGFSVAIPCYRATNANFVYDNVKCHGEEYSSKVQSACPVTCGTCPDGRPRRPQSPNSQGENVRSSRNTDCGRVHGGSPRKHFSYGGSCKCAKGTVLGGSCPSGHNFKRGERYYSKKTMAGFSDLTGCKCE